MRSVFAPPVEEAAAAAVPLTEDFAVDDGFIASGACELLPVPVLCVPVLCVPVLCVPVLCVPVEILALLLKVSVK